MSESRFEETLPTKNEFEGVLAEPDNPTRHPSEPAQAERCPTCREILAAVLLTDSLLGYKERERILRRFDSWHSAQRGEGGDA